VILPSQPSSLKPWPFGVGFARVSGTLGLDAALRLVWSGRLVESLLLRETAAIEGEVSPEGLAMSGRGATLSRARDGLSRNALLGG